MKISLSAKIYLLSEASLVCTKVAHSLALYNHVIQIFCIQESFFNKLCLYFVLRAFVQLSVSNVMLNGSEGSIICFPAPWFDSELSFFLFRD